MTFDQSVLLGCVIAPFVLSAIALGAGRWLKTSTKIDSVCSAGLRSALVAWVFAIGWWVAMAVAMMARQGFQLWPPDSWQRCVWPLLAWSFLAVGAIDTKDRSWRWLMTVTLSGVTSFLCLPRGEAWEDTYEIQGLVGIGLTISMVANAWSLDRMARRGTERWLLLVSLAAFGGPFALAASTYASLAEWGLGLVSATTAFSLAGLLLKMDLVWAVAPGAASASVCLLAAGRFQTYEDHPSWLYAVMLLFPSLVASVDALLQGRSTWIRVAVAACLSMVAVGTSVWYVLIRETEAW